MSRLILPRRDLIVPNRKAQRGFLINPYALATGGGPTDPYFSSVVSLLHFDGASGSTTFTDQKGLTWSRTGTAPQIDTSQSLFGGASISFTGAGGYIETTGVSAPGSSDFTVDIAIRPTSSSATRIFFDMRPNSTQGFYLTIYQSGLNLIFHTNSASRITATSALTLNAWHQLRLSKNSGSTRLFVNGTQVGSTYTDANTYVGSRIRIGDAGDATGNFFTGNVDEFRYTVGVGRSAANYTPDTQAFPNS